MIPRRELLSWTLVPLALNALLYLAYRDWSLWCFRWVEWGGAVAPVAGLRQLARGLGDPGEFVRYSLASGLWIFGVTSYLCAAWRGQASRHGARAWILGLVVLCVGSELLQVLGWLPGTADPSDVLAYLVGAGAAWLRFQRRAPGPAGSSASTRAAHAACGLVVGAALLLATGAVHETRRAVSERAEVAELRTGQLAAPATLVRQARGRRIDPLA